MQIKKGIAALVLKYPFTFNIGQNIYWSRVGVLSYTSFSITALNTTLAEAVIEKSHNQLH